MAEQEQFEFYVVASVSGRLMWNTFSLWEKRSIYKFCKPEDWPKWRLIGYHVRKLTCIAETHTDGIFEMETLKRELEEERKASDGTLGK